MKNNGNGDLKVLYWRVSFRSLKESMYGSKYLITSYYKNMLLSYVNNLLYLCLQCSSPNLGFCGMVKDMTTVAQRKVTLTIERKKGTQRQKLWENWIEMWDQPSMRMETWTSYVGMETLLMSKELIAMSLIPIAVEFYIYLYKYKYIYVYICKYTQVYM